MGVFSSSTPSTSGGNEQSVPMNQFGNVGFIDDVHRDRLPFFHAKHRAGRSSVVADGADDAGRSEFHCHGRNSQGEIRFGIFLRGCGRLHARHAGLRLRHQQPRRAQFDGGDATEFHEFPSVHSLLLPGCRGRSEPTCAAAPKEKSSHGGMAGSRPSHNKARAIRGNIPSAK